MSVVQVSNLVVNEIFPSTKTKTINKLITENSLTRLINRLLDVDGYVITSEFSDDFVIDQIPINKEDYIKITDNELDKDCEFSIRGYYFNIGTYRNLISNSGAYSGLATLPANPSNSTSIMASIYISNDTEYPELYGQDIYSSETISKGTASHDDIIILPDEATPTTVSINSFRFFKENTEVQVTVTGIDEQHQILDANNDPLTWGDNGYDIDKVKFVISTSSAALYLSNDTTEISNAGTGANPLTLPDIQNYDRYDLELLRIINEGGSPVPVIPLTSLHKFNTVAISNIDGGVIVDEDEG